jgi:hypothetical protein
METEAASCPIVGIVNNDIDIPDSAITTALTFFLHYTFQCHSNIKCSFSHTAFAGRFYIHYFSTQMTRFSYSLMALVIFVEY